MLNTFIHEPRVVTESSELCRWITQQQASFDLVAKCLTNVCSRPEVYDIIIWQCTAATTDCCMGYEGKTTLRDATQIVGYNIVISDAFKNAAMDAFVYSTVRNAATLSFLTNWFPWTFWGKSTA